MKRVLLLSVQLLLALAPAAAQEVGRAPSAEKCDGPVYSASEVTSKARVTYRPDVGMTPEARVNDARGVVSLAAVFCRDGRITDIEVLKGMPFGMTEKVLEGVRRYVFTPAEKDGQRVSQRIRLEYGFNVESGEECKAGECAGRLVETLVVQGNRRLTDEEIVRHIKTRPGGKYDEDQARRDLQTLLGLSLFDTTRTNLRVEQGARGGVVLIFHVTELPIVRDLGFKNLRGVTESEALKALRAERVGFCKECPFDPAKAFGATEAVRALLVARGWPNATVDLRVDELSSVSVALTFVVFPEGQ